MIDSVLWIGRLRRNRERKRKNNKFVCDEKKGWVGEEGEKGKAMVKFCDGVIVLDLLEWKVW